MTDDHKRSAVLDWTGGLRFTASAPGGPAIAIDGDGRESTSPVTTLLCAAGACSGADVVSILEKKRITLTRFHIDVGGRRADDYPRRFLEIWLRFELSGEGLTEAAARQAVDLSVQKYCSVLLSLNPDIPIRTEIVIE
ncbi:MAG TPA: OsmC family protein [Gemmatimonadales bacterium]|jgi:putative redox protein